MRQAETGKNLMSISKEHAFKNVVYAALNKGVTLACAGLTTMVVARNLTARDYGVVGFATIIIEFLLQFADMGLLRAAIRRPSIQARSLETAFTLKALLSFSVFGLALSVAPLSRHFLDHPATANVIRILSINFLVTTIGFGSRVVLTREMNYRALMVPSAVAAVAQAAAVIVLILRGWSYWAVVIGDVVSNLTAAVVLQLMRGFPGRFYFDWSDAREYLNFGLPLFGSGVVIFVITNLDNFLVSVFMGSVQLGYYALAFTWSNFICILLSETVNNVLLPALARIQDDASALRRWYLKTIDLTAFVSVIANTTLMVNAHWFLVTFLGQGSEKWLPAQSALQILCIYGVLRAVTAPLSPCLMARGQTKPLWNANLLIAAIEMVLLLAAVRSGRVELVASAMVISFPCGTWGLMPFLRRELSVELSDIGAQIWPVIPAMVVASIFTSLLPASLGGTMLTLLLRGLFTASVAALTHGLCTRFRCFHETRGMIWQNVERMRA